MLEDLCMPGHAVNRTGPDHSKYEKEANERVNNGMFDNTYPLPIDPDGPNPEYVLSGWGFMTPNFFSFDPIPTIGEFADHAATMATLVRMSSLTDHKAQNEILFDTAIKVVASVIYKFYKEIGDSDVDGVLDTEDNCIDTPNLDQADFDGDGQGDLCDADNDNDGINDIEDNCPTAVNPDQADLDSDNIGDACDPDIDGDGVLNENDGCEFTLVGKVVDASTGCAIEQLVPCDGPWGTTGTWKNHGQYVSALAKTVETFVGKGLISEEEGQDFVAAAALSDCGK